MIICEEGSLSCAGLRDLRLTFSPVWLRNFVAACGLARSTAAYDGGFGVYFMVWWMQNMVNSTLWPRAPCGQEHLVVKWHQQHLVVKWPLTSGNQLEISVRPTCTVQWPQPFCYYCSARKPVLILTYYPTEGGRLSWYGWLAGYMEYYVDMTDMFNSWNKLIKHLLVLK